MLKYVRIRFVKSDLFNPFSDQCLFYKNDEKQNCLTLNYVYPLNGCFIFKCFICKKQ